jgi:hypothetical protein
VAGSFQGKYGIAAEVSKEKNARSAWQTVRIERRPY